MIQMLAILKVQHAITFILCISKTVKFHITCDI